MRRLPGWLRWASLAIGAALLARITESGAALGREVAIVADARTFEFTYEVSLDAPPRGGGPINVFVPLAQSSEQQEILSREIVSTVPGEERTENVYGNRFWHGRVGAADARRFRFAARYLVRRKAFRNPAMPPGRIQDGAVSDRPANPRGDAGDSGDSWNLARFLAPDERVPVSGPLIDAIRKEIRPADGSKLARARAIYDYVIDNMEYKKVGTGWGNGDTYWACSARYGNCTDFHALFISLARAEGIPARFEIGFPVPEDRAEGAIAGYHCWVEFYLPGVGWIPADASEAWKHPERRDLYFGTHPPDRIQLTVGRDLELGEGHASGPLNYFVYPHVEAAGKKVAVRTRFGYREARRAYQRQRDPVGRS